MRLLFITLVKMAVSAPLGCCQTDRVPLEWFPSVSGSVHYDEGESEAESLTSNMDMTNPIFQLYEAVRGARNSQGQLIAEPFLQLPSKKDYPDYYQQISQPICLHQIKYGLTLLNTLSASPPLEEELRRHTKGQ